MGKLIAFENLVKAIREKLGVDAADEIAKALQTDMEALRDNIATKSDSRIDQMIEQMAADMAALKTVVGEVKAGLAAIKIPEPVTLEAIKAEPLKLSEEYNKFVTDTTTALAAISTALKSILERLATMPAPAAQKSESAEGEIPGINRGSLTPELIAVLSQTLQKADKAENELMQNSSIRWSE